METVRILINSPASQGAIGDLYNFHLDPSLTLGCGSWGSTSVSANVGPQHLINIKTGALPVQMVLLHGVLYAINAPSQPVDQGLWHAFVVRSFVVQQPGYNHNLTWMCWFALAAVAMRQENMLWFKAPPKIYFKRGSLDLGLAELKG